MQNTKLITIHKGDNPYYYHFEFDGRKIGSSNRAGLKFIQIKQKIARLNIDDQKKQDLYNKFYFLLSEKIGKNKYIINSNHIANIFIRALYFVFENEIKHIRSYDEDAGIYSNLCYILGIDLPFGENQKEITKRNLFISGL